jgi:DNA-directed RNA polymerase specialized sigma24 family protein
MGTVRARSGGVRIPRHACLVFKGTIFLRCAEKGIGQLPRPSTTLEPADAAEIACETVAEAIKSFRKRVLIPGKWDMTRGASLNTFFVGHCVLRFPNVYRRWYREEQDQLLVLSDLASLKVELSMLRTEGISPDRGAELSRTVRELHPRDPKVIVGLTELGYDQKDMAGLLDTTVRGIQSRLFRHRRRRES